MRGELKRIRFERFRHGWNQTQLAERAGIRQTTLSAIENGRLKPTANQLLLLAAALNLPADELLRPVVAVVDSDVTSDRIVELATR